MNLSVVWPPIWKRVPLSSRASAVRFPSTHVPFALSRSRSVATEPFTTSVAWRRETPSSRMRTSQSSRRPTTSSRSGGSENTSPSCGPERTSRKACFSEEPASRGTAVQVWSCSSRASLAPRRFAGSFGCVVRFPPSRFAIDRPRPRETIPRPSAGRLRSDAASGAPCSGDGLPVEFRRVTPRAGGARVIRFGPAGWEYPDWAGIVYPKPAPRGFDRLSWLARFFATVEVNATFYRPFPADVAARWCERVRDAPGFRFGAKVWRRFTHERADAYGADDVKQARAALDRLRAEGRLGAALLQFPWSFKRDAAGEEWLRGLFRAFAGLPLVVEVRHLSWDAPDVLAELAEAGVGIVNVDQPLFRDSIRPAARVTSPVAYVRVHGRNYKDWFRKDAGRDARYDYLYTAGELDPWARRIGELASGHAPGGAGAGEGEGGEAPDVYVVTNNHFRGQAAANAKMLEAMVEGRKVEAPGELIERYGVLR